MRAALFALLGCGLAVAVVACVGDSTVAPNDGGSDATSLDSSTTDSPTADVASDGPSDSSAPWTPAQLDTAGSLALWLDTSDSNNLVVSSNQVEQWTDRSKNHNNATNPNVGPSLNANALNGYSSVHFSAHGVVLQIADATSLQFASDQVLILAVAKASTDGLYFFSKHTTHASGGGPYFYTGLEFEGKKDTPDGGVLQIAPFVHFAEDPTDSGTPTTYPAEWNGRVFDDGNFHIVGMRRTNPGEMVLLVDGQTPQTTSTGGYDVSEPGKPVDIGSVAYGNIAPAMDGEIVEIVIVHETVIPDAVLANIQTYLKAKYAL